MGFISWIILGLIAGALAKVIMPGDDGNSWFKTMILGIVGAFVGGFVGQFAGFAPANGVNFPSIAVATVGALIVLFINKKFFSK